MLSFLQEAVRCCLALCLFYHFNESCFPWYTFTNATGGKLTIWDLHTPHVQVNYEHRPPTKEHLFTLTGFSNNDRSLLLFSFEFSTITLIYAWIILKTELTLIITNYKYILAGVKGMHRPVDASQ